MKHAIECDFSSVQSQNELNAPSSESTRGSSIAETSTSSAIHTNTSSPPHQSSSASCNPAFSFPLVPVFVPVQQRLALSTTSQLGWTMQDMELMHHFTLAAPAFLASNEAVAGMWRDAVPKLAFSDEYGCAMHGILAVAALHLAFLEPENRSMRLITATAHYDQAVRTISAMISNICKDNCETLFISSSLIVVFATASPLLPGNSGHENEPWSLPEWIPLIRGVHSILKQVWDWVETGRLGAMLGFRFYDGPDPLPEEMKKILGNLYRLCTDTSEPDPEEIRDTDISSTYFTAIHELQKSFSNSVDSGSSMVSLMFLWPVSLSDKFVTLLKEKRPRALVIFAHYCALLKRIESYWWVDGRAEYELVRIERSIEELDKWKKWLVWPTKMVRG